MESTCTICASPSCSSKACARCHSKYYSLECEQTDWPSHSLLCSQFTTHTGRPDPSYKRAILFPSNETNPKLLWIECRIEDDDEYPGSTWESGQVHEYLGGTVGQYDAFPERKLIQRNILRDRNLANSLEVVCRETFLIDGSESNKSIIRATHGSTGHTWKGPIVALKKQGLGMDPLRYLDIDMQDYRDVVDYFTSYGDESVQDTEVRHDRKGKVRGVKINCEGDQRTFGAEPYSAVNVPQDHPVFYSPVAPISELVGMPVRTTKYPPDRLWKDNHDDVSDLYENVPATVLHRVLDPSTGDRWGWAPMQWQNDVGSVLVVRSDGQDMTTQQLEVLSHFCQFKLQPLIENAMGGGLVEMTREEVMGYMTPDGFGHYFAEMRAKKIREGGDAGWRTAGVPG